MKPTDAARSPPWTSAARTSSSPPYYYIQQNDTIYVTPAERKINTRSDTVQYIGWTASGLGLIIGIVALCAL